TQTAVNAAFATWLGSVQSGGGCGRVVTTNPATPVAPNACGGSITVTWTATSDCEAPKSCSSTFTVTAASAVTLTCPTPQTVGSCQTQTAVNAAFATWLGSVQSGGGCGRVVTTNPATPVAPNACGGSITVTWTATSDCEAPKSCSSTFTVTAAPAVTLTCPTPQTVGSCQTQTAVNAAFATWLGSVQSGGGCGRVVTTNPATPVAPNACGGSITVTWTATSDCETKSCSSTFTVTAAPAVTLTCPTPRVEESCQTQTAINTKFAAWLLTVQSGGGCGRVVTTNPATPVAPNACGGSITVTWTATSDCEAPKSCSSTFTVTAAPAVTLTCPTPQTVGSCQTQTAVNAAFATWLGSVQYGGGCGRVVTTNPATPVAPN